MNKKRNKVAAAIEAMDFFDDSIDFEDEVADEKEAACDGDRAAVLWLNGLAEMRERDNCKCARAASWILAAI